MVPRPGHRLPRVAPGPDRGQRLARVRPVQAGRPGGAHEPWSLQVLGTSGDRIAGLTFFLDTDRFFPLFGLPQEPEARTI